jgi:hypothetical protein
MRPRIVIKGDEELGKEYIDVALLELSKLRTSMGFQKLRQDVRKTIFDDGTVIRCTSVFGDETIIIDTLRTKIKEEEKEEKYRISDLIIVLRKDVDGKYDYWYWNLAINGGYHADPQVEVPTNPEIISKWWSCEELEEVEYYTRATPALQPIATGGCADECGLTHFSTGECCNEAEGADNESDVWYLCPCGGVGQEVAGFPYYVCREELTCGICGTSHIDYPAGHSTQSRTSNQTQDCPLGYSWEFTFGDLAEKIEIGPRIRASGFETKDIWTVEAAVCGPYVTQLHHCDDISEDGCSCYGNDIWLGSECGDPQCSGYDFITGNSYSMLFESQGFYFQGCVDFLETVKENVAYSTEVTNIITKTTVGEKETSFNGAWSQYTSGSGLQREGHFRRGQTTSCLECDGAGAGWGDWYTNITYSYTETSYGVAGWRTVVTEDGRIAILIPKLDLSASAISADGVPSGNIAGTTTALLRIVDDSDHDYELAEGESDYSLDFMPSGRSDLGIKPNCYPREFPLDLTLCGFHWLVETAKSRGVVTNQTDSLLTAFVMSNTFYAYLAERTIKKAWQNTELLDFEKWVADNNLESYVMYLGRIVDEKEILQ